MAAARPPLLLVLLALLPLARAEDVAVETSLGFVVGERAVLGDGAAADIFRGLPFALPPTGDRRWAPPNTTLAPWAEPRDAKTFAPSCPNVCGGGTGTFDGCRPVNESGTPLCRTCSTRNVLPLVPNDEDCLYLNVVTQPGASDGAEKLPVAVFVHGGGSLWGWAGAYTNTTALSGKGVVFVSLQYRLASLGFMATSGGELDGNYAVQDIAAALRWVRDEIGAFGGDPTRVMLFGQSAGAQLVQATLLSPLSEGLVHAAALESSASLRDFEEDGADSDAFFGSLGCAGGASAGERLACARALPWRDVVDGSFGRFNKRFLDKGRGDVLPRQPRDALAAGAFTAVPLLLGYNLQEGTIGDYFSGDGFYDTFLPQAASDESVRDAVGRALGAPCCNQTDFDGAVSALMAGYGAWEQTGYGLAAAARADASNGASNAAVAMFWAAFAPVHLYAFGARSTSAAMAPFGAMHLLELMFVLNDTALFDGHPMSGPELELADAMGSAWAQFAKTGAPAPVRPGGSTSGECGDRCWPAFNATDPQWYVISMAGGMASAFRKAQLDFFASWKGVTGPTQPTPAGGASTLTDAQIAGICAGAVAAAGACAGIAIKRRQRRPIDGLGDPLVPAVPGS